MIHWRTRSLRTKITCLFFAATIATALLICTVFFSWAKRNMFANAVETQRGLLGQISSNIDALQHNLMDLSSLIALDPQTYATADAMRDIISTHTPLSMIAYYTVGEETGVWYYSDQSCGLVPFSAFQQTDLYRKASAARGKPVWCVLNENEDNLITVDAQQDRIIMASSVRTLNSGFHESGLLLLGIQRESIGTLCNADTLPPGQGILMTDADGKLLYSCCPSSIDITHAIQDSAAIVRPGYWEATIDGKNRILLSTSDNYLGWTLYLVTNRDGILRDVDTAVFSSVLLGIVCILFAAFFLIYFISRMITKPIEALHASMTSLAGGDWQQHVPIKGHGEISALGVRYNEMVQELRRLVDENYVMALHEREAELHALQAQINPHFLYNTLAILHAMSIAAEQDRLAELTLALSNLFRISLSRPNSWITVAEEADFLHNYLTIQKALLCNRVVSICAFDPAMLCYGMPKLMLQPFIENAITHGISKQVSGGLVEIYGHLQDDQLIFTIEDNGMGMSAETLKEIQSPPRRREAEHGHAVWNVLERLRLTYGDACSVEITSVEGDGVCVKITLPAWVDKADRGRCPPTSLR